MAETARLLHIAAQARLAASCTVLPADAAALKMEARFALRLARRGHRAPLPP